MTTLSAPGDDSALPRFGVVVPVKRLTQAKTRLAELGDPLRQDLVAAFALDTVAASVECALVGAVLVVTDELSLALPMRELGAQVIPDTETGRLNAVLRQGAAELLRLRPTLRPVALCGDLPCLRAEDLEATLRGAVTVEAGYVADASGSGTTLYTASTLQDFDPRFGPDSAAAHHASGASALEAPAGVRRDVDTPADLEAALGLGAGSHTRLVATLGGIARH